ncbi:ABC transporter permease subunit [[Acholeplasma] multilocale]|uniref:ABC transporter permease subunit n=1 Tax=[Acholeplasma] multilocale TaxID=264638 RepID=UPI00047E20C4|nr:ABC transporter permease subunit [[Acholeplasma] multilocale]
MFNRHIIKSSLKGSWVIWLILTIMSLAIIAVFFFVDGLGSASNTISSFYFLSLGVEVPIIFTSIIANSLITKEVERGHMAFYLSTPNSRTVIMFNKLITVLIFVLMTFASHMIVGGILITIRDTDITMLLWTKWMVNYAAFVTLLFAIGWIFSCTFNKSSKTLLAGAGVPILFFVFNMISNIPNIGLEFLQYISINSLFDPSAMITGGAETWVGQTIALLVASSGLFGWGMYIFNKKDLPL